MANEDTLRECHRVLKRGGALVMVWNTIDSPQQWIRELDHNLLTRHYDDEHTPRYITNEWEFVFSSPSALDLYSLPLTKWSGAQRNKQHGTKQDIVDKILSVSVVSSRPLQEREGIAREVREFLDGHPDTAAAARLDQLLPLEYRTEVAWLVTN